MTGRHRRRLAGLLVTAALLASGPAASATPQPRAQGSYTDRTGDAIDGRGDIVSWRLRHGATRVELRVRTREGSDPLQALPWLGTNTSIAWFLDTDAGRNGPEYRATFRVDRTPPSSTYVVAVVRNLRTDTVGAGCAGTSMEEETAGWFSYPDSYVLSTPRRCIGTPSRVRGWVQMTWDPRPRGGRQGIDRAPTAGASSWVRPG